MKGAPPGLLLLLLERSFSAAVPTLLLSRHPLHTLSPRPPPPPRPPCKQVLRRYGGSTVVATLAGHTHNDGFHTDSAGIRHRVCKAVLETPPGRHCYGVVHVYADRVELCGVDTFASESWPLEPPQQQQEQQQEQPQSPVAAAAAPGALST